MEFLITIVILILLGPTICRAANGSLIKHYNRKLQKRILSGTFIPAREFESHWITHKQGRKGIAGYKYTDGPGCYVIAIYDSDPQGDFKSYDDIYIGQSVKICQRVHNHLNGKGNGDVYADFKYGRHIYVHFEPCARGEMNNLERSLISSFNATESYNSTKGGGARR